MTGERPIFAKSVSRLADSAGQVIERYVEAGLLGEEQMEIVFDVWLEALDSGESGIQAVEGLIDPQRLANFKRRLGGPYIPSNQES